MLYKAQRLDYDGPGRKNKTNQMSMRVASSVTSRASSGNRDDDEHL